MLTFEGQVAAVVGGGWKEPGGSIGGAACRVLARGGAQVAVVDLDRAVADATADLISSEGGSAEVFVADASDDGDCRGTIDAVVTRFGRLDVLVNNIGVGSPGSVVDLDEERWDWVMSTNVKSVVLMCRHAIPRMRDGGAIVNLSSMAALRPPPGSASYPTSKAAIEALTRSLAHDYGRRGIRANCVRPGEIATWRVLENLDEERQRAVYDRVRARSVLGTVGDAWDIAHAIAFLASAEARWITGQVILVDGGADLKRAELWPLD